MERATEADIPRIMECAREFCIQLVWPLNESHYQDTWRGFLQSGQGCIFLLVNDDGQVAGGIGGIKRQELLSGDWMAVELFWYVRPEFRRGMWPIKLLRAFEQWAVASQCKHISMIAMRNSMPEKMEDFYLRYGYEVIETVYHRKIT